MAVGGIFLVRVRRTPRDEGSPPPPRVKNAGFQAQPPLHGLKNAGVQAQPALHGLKHAGFQAQASPNRDHFRVGPWSLASVSSAVFSQHGGQVSKALERDRAGPVETPSERVSLDLDEHALRTVVQNDTFRRGLSEPIGMGVSVKLDEKCRLIVQSVVQNDAFRRGPLDSGECEFGSLLRMVRRCRGALMAA